MTGKKADVRFMDDSDVEYGEEEYGSSEGEDEQFFTDVNHKALMQLQEQKMSEEMAVVINWDNLVTELENCPKIPQPPVVEQINPPSQPMRREKFGKLMPDDDDKKKDKKGAAKKPAAKDAKKGEAPKPVKWAAGPPPQHFTTSHHLAAANKGLQANVFPMNCRGEMGNPGIAPVIIKEVYFPPEAPYDVATLIESALVYQNSSNYALAIECL